MIDFHIISAALLLTTVYSHFLPQQQTIFQSGLHGLDATADLAPDSSQANDYVKRVSRAQTEFINQLVDFPIPFGDNTNISHSLVTDYEVSQLMLFVSYFLSIHELFITY